MNTAWGEMRPQSFSVRLPRPLPAQNIDYQVVRDALPGIIIREHALCLRSFGEAHAVNFAVPCFHLDSLTRNPEQKLPHMTWKLFLNFGQKAQELLFLDSLVPTLGGKASGERRIYLSPPAETILVEPLSARDGQIVHGVLFAPSRIPHLECTQPPPLVAMYAATATLRQTVSYAMPPNAP